MQLLPKKAVCELALTQRLLRCVAVLLLLGLAVAMHPPPCVAEDIKPEITAALDAGDTAQAIRLLQEQIELDKGYHANYYLLGLIYVDRNQMSQAKEMFHTALEKKSKHWESLYELGLCYLALDQIDSAKAVMEQGRKKASKGLKHVFENGYGLAMLRKGQYEEAQRGFMTALIDRPDDPDYLINLGDAYLYQGVPSLAATYYEKALELDTGSTEVYYHWAEACIDMRNYNCAIEKLRIVLSRDSTFANAWMRAGGIYFKAALSTPTQQDRVARFRDAIGSYRRYVELSGAQPDSTNVRVFFELAMSYVNLFGFDDAVKYFEDVLSIPYEPRDIYFYYAKALWGIQQFEKSGEMLLKHIAWVEEQPDEDASRVDEVELYQLLGDSYFYRQSKDYAAAIPYYLRSLQMDPSQKRILENVAIAYHTTKSYAQAIEYYEKRIELGIDTAKAGIFKNAAYCALNLASNAEAFGEDEDLDELIDSEDGSSAGPDANPDRNYYEEAAEYLVEYLQFYPADTAVMSMVANTYLYQLGDCERGVQYYEQVLARDARNCGALKALGFAYFGGICPKNYTKAVGYLKQAYDCLAADKGACADVSLLLWLGQCYHLRAAAKAQAKEDANDDFRGAFEWYEKCLKCEPSNVDCKKGRDEVYLEFGD